MLAAAGQDISAGKPLGTNTGAAVQGNISSQNYMKMLQSMLSGNIPDGGKITMDGKGMTMNIPKMQGTGPGGVWEGMAAPLGSPTSFQGKQWSGGVNAINPSSSPANESAGNATGLAGLGASDLAGLTPDMISQALQFKFAKEEMGQKKMSDLMDMVYKLALTEQATAQAEKYREGEPLDKPFPVGVPNIGSVTVREWNALSKGQQDYALYVHGAKKLGDDDIMSQQEFNRLDPTDREKFLRSALDDPALMKAAKDLAAAGGTKISIGEAAEKAGAVTEATDLAKAFVSVKTGGVVSDVDKVLTKRGLDSAVPTDAEFIKNYESILKKTKPDLPEGKYSRAAQESVADAARKAIRLKAIDAEVRNRVSPSLGKGEKVEFAEDENGVRGWYTVYGDGSYKLLLEAPK